MPFLLLELLWYIKYGLCNQLDKQTGLTTKKEEKGRAITGNRNTQTSVFRWRFNNDSNKRGRLCTLMLRYLHQKAQQFPGKLPAETSSHWSCTTALFASFCNLNCYFLLSLFIFSSAKSYLLAAANNETPIQSPCSCVFFAAFFIRVGCVGVRHSRKETVTSRCLSSDQNITRTLRAADFQNCHWKLHSTGTWEHKHIWTHLGLHPPTHTHPKPVTALKDCCQYKYPILKCLIVRKDI